MNQTEPSKEPDNSRTAKSERNRQRQILRDRITGVASSMIDAAERIVETLNAPQPKLPTPPLAVARRQLSNRLRLAQFCDLKTCRRARCCRGEPLHCLQIAVPLLPPEDFENLLRKQSARAAKRKRRLMRRSPA